MYLPLELRRATLAAHIVCSVGWLGAAAAYLALGIAAAVSRDMQIVRAAWIGMELTGWFVIVPLACLAFLSGLLLSLGTPWGLFRHYWVIIALPLTALSLVVLLLHMPSVSAAAALARTADDVFASQLGGDVVHPAVGLVVLVVVTVLNVHKPAASPPTGNANKRKNAVPNIAALLSHPGAKDQLGCRV